MASTSIKSRQESSRNLSYKDVERIRLEAQAKKEIAKRDAVFQANLYFAVQEMTGKRKRMKVREETTAADEKVGLNRPETLSGTH